MQLKDGNESAFLRSRPDPLYYGSVWVRVSKMKIRIRSSGFFEFRFGFGSNSDLFRILKEKINKFLKLYAYKKCDE